MHLEKKQPGHRCMYPGARRIPGVRFPGSNSGKRPGTAGKGVHCGIAVLDLLVLSLSVAVLCKASLRHVAANLVADPLEGI